MGLLDKYLPSSTSLSGSIGNIADGKISYSLAPVGKVINESFGKAQDTFGDLKKKFKKLTSNGEDLKKVIPDPPKTTANTATDIKSATGENLPDSANHKVTLTASAADGESFSIQNNPQFPSEPLMQRRVEFDVMPEVSEVRNVDYEALQTPQMPGEFQKYKGTKSTQWTITGVFTARTKAEAYRNYLFLNTLRGWTMPYFGMLQARQFGGNGGEERGKLGAPPPVIQFAGWRGIVGPVPVVVTALNWTWPKECDWIPTGIKDDEGQEIPFPTVMNVNITIVESFSAEQFNSFNLVEFRNGRMVDAYTVTADQTPAPDVAEPVGGNSGITNGVPSPEPAPTTATATPAAEATTNTTTPATTAVENSSPIGASPATTNAKEDAVKAVAAAQTRLTSANALLSKYKQELYEAQSRPLSDPNRSGLIQIKQAFVNQYTVEVSSAELQLVLAQNALNKLT